MATTLAAGTGGTDNQAFCYDEQNRLTWASSATASGPNNPGTSTPCASNTAGNLTSAQYTYSLAYDAMNRLTYNIAGGGNYQYGAAGSVPLHGVTSTLTGGSTVASVSYDAVGDMTCRAPTSATTCTGTVTGQQLTYDAERRMSHWQSSPSSPTSSADYLYDGSGQRVEQVDTTSGTSMKVYYLFGGLEEVSSTGSNSTLTKYYSAGELLIGESVGGTISYLASDGLGSVSEALSTSGTVTAAQLYGPYGGVRYSSGTMPTAKGFTGQRADATTSGLDYYGARYYDPLLGQFTSADTQQGPNRFAYVADDPETLTDPTGHCGGGNLRANCEPPPPPPPGKNPPPGKCTSNCNGGHHKGKHGGGGNNNGSGTQLPASIEGLCGAIGGLCDWITSKLSSISPTQWGDILRMIGVVIAAVGIVVLVYDVLNTLKNPVNRAEKFEKAVDIIQSVIGGVGLLSAWPGMPQGVVYAITGMLNGVLGIIHAALGIFNTLGWFGQGAVNAGITLAANVAEGEVAPIEDVADAAFGTSISYLLSAAGSGLLYAGEGLISWGYSLQGT